VNINPVDILNPVARLGEMSARGFGLRAWIRTLRIAEVPESSESQVDTVLDTGANEIRGFGTPEAAALSGYSASSGAYVVRKEVISDNRVDVIVDTDPSHTMRVHCDREGDLWFEAGDIVE
jgi:hypothetical protein